MSGFENMTNSPPPPPSLEAPPEQRTMAMLSHLLGILTGFIGALVIWLINKDKPGTDFVVDQSKEALNFQITITIGMIVSVVLSVVIIGFFLMFALWIANLALSIMAGIKANEGMVYRYPFTLRLIK